MPRADVAAVAARLEQVAAKEETLQSELRRGQVISLVPPEFTDEIEYLD